MNEPKHAAEIDRAINNFIAQLQEFGCDSVRVLVSCTEKSITFVKTKGAGNYYAQVGMAREFIDRDTAITTDDVFHENEE